MSRQTIVQSQPRNHPMIRRFQDIQKLQREQRLGPCSGRSGPGSPPSSPRLAGCSSTGGEPSVEREQEQGTGKRPLKVSSPWQLRAELTTLPLSVSASRRGNCQPTARRAGIAPHERAAPFYRAAPSRVTLPAAARGPQPPPAPPTARLSRRVLARTAARGAAPPVMPPALLRARSAYNSGKAKRRRTSLP